MDKITRFHEFLHSSSRIVFFGGAGVSTASGIPDFRSADGLYNQHYDAPPETILSRSYFVQRPETFYRFYREKMVYPQARPNAAHIALAALESIGKLRSVVTQNIDGLHQAAGSRCVWELHGSVHRNTCMRCGQTYTLQQVLGLLQNAPLPRCTCGGLIKPNVVLYEEALDETVLRGAVADIRQADLLIVAGTSLTVYPAAGLLDHFAGNKLVVINRTPTPRDNIADLLLDIGIETAFAGMKL